MSRSESRYRLLRLGKLGSSTQKVVLRCNWPRLSRDFTSYRAAATRSGHAANTLRHIGYCGIHTKTYIFEKISIHLLLSLQLQWPAIGIVLMMLRGLQFGSEVQAPRKSKIVPKNMTTKTYCRKALTNRRTCDPDHVTWKQHALM